MRRRAESTPREAAANEFQTTHWSLVVQAGKPADPEAAAALALLCERYWFPLYCYVTLCNVGTMALAMIAIVALDALSIYFGWRMAAAPPQRTAVASPAPT